MSNKNPFCFYKSKIILIEDIKMPSASKIETVSCTFLRLSLCSRICLLNPFKRGNSGTEIFLSRSEVHKLQFHEFHIFLRALFLGIW